MLHDDAHLCLSVTIVGLLLSSIAPSTPSDHVRAERES